MDLKKILSQAVKENASDIHFLLMTTSILRE